MAYKPQNPCREDLYRRFINFYHVVAAGIEQSTINYLFATFYKVP